MVSSRSLPPGAAARSNNTTSQPLHARSTAAVKPAIPAPITAMRALRKFAPEIR
jgi:hypothetical protein